MVRSALLGRVFRHLLENAARYSPPGSRIVLRSRRDWRPAGICVEDNGPGIDAADLPLIFEKFYRGKKGADERQREREWDWRLRARFCWRTAEELRWTSTPGQGTTFRFWVPLVEKEAEGTID